MYRKLLLFIVILGISTGFGPAQSFVKTSDLFKRSDPDPGAGKLNITQDPAIDTLISRYLLVNKNLYREAMPNHYGMAGYRIQIYSNSSRNARDEANKVRAEFITRFPDVISYLIYADPGYFKIRVGDFRTKTEATRLFIMISRVFPNAYIVPDFINFPELNTK